MSEQDKQDLVVAKSGVMSTAKHPRRLFRAKLGGLIAALVVVAAVIVGAVWYFNVRSTESPQSSSTKPLTPGQQAANLQVSGNYAAAQQIYDVQLKSAKTKQAQAKLYLGKASVYFAAKDYANALLYATKGDGLAPTAYTAEFMGNIAKAQGDNAAAKGYYQTALKRLNPKSATYGYEANNIQEEIDGVSS